MARFGLCAALALVLVAPSALAQQSDADRLFNEGAELMKQNRFADACPKLEQSAKLDPEIGGLLWLADCYERNGQIASAYRTYKDAQKMAIDRKDKHQRDKVAQKHIDALEPRLAKLTILAPQDSRPQGLVVTRSGTKVDSDTLGLAVPLDPGSYVVRAEAPGYNAWEQKIDVTGEGATATVTIGPLVRVGGAPPPPPAAENDPGFGFKVSGVVIGAIGLVSIGVGSVFGLLAAARLSDSNSNGHCDAADTCDTLGLSLRQEAEGDALASTILFVAGGVALVAGVVLFVAAPKKKHSSAPTFGRIMPLLGHGLYGASIGGTF